MNLFKRKQDRSDNVRQFVNRLYEFQKENPDEICPMETDAQFVVDCLKDVFLGTHWYVTMPVNDKQSNTIILDAILSQYSSQFVRLVKLKRKLRDKILG